MCGICGVVDRSSPVQKEVIQKMNRVMIHRGPDDEGIYLSKNTQGTPFVGLGHRRLSIIDLSSAGAQPISNEDNTIHLIVNGEIYNFCELRHDLQGRGHKFSSQSDSEVILHLYEEYGTDCLTYLNGMFAFALWDEKERLFFAGRDRLGKKPFQYYFDNSRFVFASEFHPLLESGYIKKEVNTDVIDDYLTFGYIPAPYSAYKNVFKIPPAHYLTYKSGKVEVVPYWNLSYKEKIPGNIEDACEGVFHLLTDAVRIRLASDVPVGAFLSGGIDSSIVVGLLSNLSSEKIKTFSIGFSEDQYNELSYAKAVADHFSCDHHEYIVKPDALEVLPLLIERYGEPYADSSAIPTYYVSKLTKQHVTVALNGDGGDEVFAGYERYLAMVLSQYYFKIPKSVRSLFIDNLIKKIPDSFDPKNPLRRVRRFFEGANEPFVDRYARWVGIFNRQQKKELYSSEFKNSNSLFCAIDRFTDQCLKDNAANVVDRLLMTDTNTYLPYDLLVKVDIASMANSLEARSPFLDYRLMEYAAALRPSFKLRGFTTKYILKKLFRQRLPKKNVYRKKMGFGVPVRRWFRDELKELLFDTLLSDRCLNRGYFNPSVIKKMVNGHVDGGHDYSYHLWTLLTFELWHKRFIDF